MSPPCTFFIQPILSAQISEFPKVYPISRRDSSNFPQQQIFTPPPGTSHSSPCHLLCLPSPQAASVTAEASGLQGEHPYIKDLGLEGPCCTAPHLTHTTNKRVSPKSNPDSGHAQLPQEHSDARSFRVPCNFSSMSKFSPAT